MVEIREYGEKFEAPRKIDDVSLVPLPDYKCGWMCFHGIPWVSINFYY